MVFIVIWQFVYFFYSSGRINDLETIKGLKTIIMGICVALLCVIMRYNPSIGEAKSGEPCIQGQPGQHSRLCFNIKKQMQNN
jgi:hypothetical protein